MQVPVSYVIEKGVTLGQCFDIVSSFCRLQIDMWTACNGQGRSGGDGEGAEDSGDKDSVDATGCTRA